MANCPYKVRRFNFSEHSAGIEKPLENLLNPNVTVRSRGVVEKCTFCVQRINKARNKSKLEGLDAIPDGAFTTACAESCPRGAIVFGNVNSRDSKISKMLRSEKPFCLLGDRGTRPSVFYLI
jgi:molybdopterin-containing oxidoreductase family iron-sulfur binding subunit